MGSDRLDESSPAAISTFDDHDPGRGSSWVYSPSNRMGEASGAWSCLKYLAGLGIRVPKAAKKSAFERGDEVHCCNRWHGLCLSSNILGRRVCLFPR